MRLKFLLIIIGFVCFCFVSIILFIEFSSYMYKKKFFNSNESIPIILVEDTKGSIISLSLQESLAVNLRQNPKQLYSDNGNEINGVVFEKVPVRDIAMIDSLLPDDKYRVFISDDSGPYRDVALTHDVKIKDLCVKARCKWAAE